ncbi:MAG: hypothetical protein KGL39_40720 [Patescibacteria group bacterium]|nr:hypothetical protein [Patescibacteria group bacterium]
MSEAERKKLERGLSEFVNRTDGSGELILHFYQGAIRRIELRRTIT